MSDNIEDLVKKYKESVFYGRHPRSIGLFPIPEYPEYEEKRGMWGAALDAILTTLRYLAPATLLTLFWGQQSFFFRILKHIDSAFRAIVFSSEEQKKSVLEWLSECGPVRVESLDTVWRHGWIVCGVLDAALPGACAGHPPTTLSIKHAQVIAEHYLGVEPVFSRQELESNDGLSKHQEWKLATYLDRIRQALRKLTPPVSKPTSQRTSPESTQFTLDYVAKGSGLTAAQIHNKMYFKIYPTAQQALDPGEITILIRGPKDTYGMTVLPPILGKAQLIRQKLLGLQTKQNFTETALPLTQGAAYLRNYGKNDMNKTYFIPKTRYDIEIEVERRSDHAKVCYKVGLEGRYEIYLTSRGQNIVGSPFYVTASRDIISILERDSFSLEDGEEIDIVDVKTDRKVVLRIVDFVTEKMLLKENGSLEKISDEEANILMSTTNGKSKEIKHDNDANTSERKQSVQVKSNKFNKIASKVITMNRVCRIFNDLIEEKLFNTSLSAFLRPNQQYIPDIVNSTLTDTTTNPFILTEKVDKFIVPERISVSIRTEKLNEEVNNTKSSLYDSAEIKSEPNMLNSELNFTNILESLEKLTTDTVFIDHDNTERSTPSSASNPFLNDIYEENYTQQKSLGTYVTSEYETNNFQHEETRDSSIKIIIQESDSIPSPSNNNPFTNENILELERPKSPVFKIMSREIDGNDESVYVDAKNELISEDMLGNEFINPFFVHHHHPNSHEQLPITDFIIGAPVSLPPMIRVPSPEPITDQMRSLSITTEEIKNENSDFIKIKINDNENVENVDKYSQTDLLKASTLTIQKSNNRTDNILASSTFHSLETGETIDQSIASTANDKQYDPYHSDNSSRSSPPRKDMWDSAYVSIDENNTFADNNNIDNTEIYETNAQRLSPSNDKFGLKLEELTNMGPAEREIWQTCNELNENKNPEDIKSNRWEFKRSIFTPIIEENDRSISTGTKEAFTPEIITKHSETDPVTVAFAELNDLYHEYFPKSETSDIADINAVSLQTFEGKNDDDYTCVNSASANVPDVKRHEDKIEGTISEVQTNVTESVSVSPTLQHINIDQLNEGSKQIKEEIHFCDKQINIVLEKKKYWDEKIRQIEAKSKETTTLHKKRPASKQLKHDSLTKRKGKQIVKNLLNVNNNQPKPKEAKTAEIDPHTQFKISEPITRLTNVDQEKADENLVEKWKKYWDDKLELVVQEDEEVQRRTMTLMKRQSLKSPEKKKPDVLMVNQIKIPIAKMSETDNKIKHDTKIKPEHINKSTEIKEQELKTPAGIAKEVPKQVNKSYGTEVKLKKETKNNTQVENKKPEFSKYELSPDNIKFKDEVSSSETEMKSGDHVKPETKSKIITESNDTKFKPSPLPIKQEIPEEVYKAFETSPKRFFGTSRKHILNKIDTFLGKPNIEEKASVEVVSTSYDTGLVSSRISLFHNLTNTEELSWTRKKSQSLQNINQRKDSEKGNVFEIRDSGRSSVPTDSGKINLFKNVEPAKSHVLERRSSPVDSDCEFTTEKKILENKRARLLNSFGSSFDEKKMSKVKETLIDSSRSSCDDKSLPSNIGTFVEDKPKKYEPLRKTSISKSEMDIFNKVPDQTVDDYLDKHKSFDELPKISVKNFISLYESVSRSTSSVDANSVKGIYRTSSTDSQKHLPSISTKSDAAKPVGIADHSTVSPSTSSSDLSYQSPKKLTLAKRSDTLNSVNSEDYIDIKVVKDDGKETTYVCLSDIELEIIESSPDRSLESSPEKTTVAAHIEYKNRFKSAKEYFKSLEELREVKKPRKLNECELLLQKHSTESLIDDRPHKRVKKKIKSRSLPSSEISRIWSELQESQRKESSTKLVKISEKFNVDDLFSDVMEGKLSRQGSLRGIPHKKAVLEAFRSMENIADNKLSSYELTASQVDDFTKDNHVKNAQTYLTEYPYLPTTDPSKYHSRLDKEASGLISFKELLEKRPRRNSVPDLRLNPKFTVDL